MRLQLPLLRQILPISLPQTKRTNPSRTRWDKKERCWVALADHTWGIIGMKADMEALKDQMASMMEAMLSMKRMMESNTAAVAVSNAAVKTVPTHPSATPAYRGRL